MLEFDGIEDKTQDIIKVIGVGGGGCNAVNNMYREGINNVSFAVLNTDSQSLKNSPVPVKLQLGVTGLGAGANPDRGRQEAQDTIEELHNLLDDGTKMCFITAGMGGGTGTGAAPVVASVAKEMGILTVGIVTIPFFFEKPNKIIKALKGVEELRRNVDALLIVNNERLCDIYMDSQVPIKEAFKTADKILSDATRSISELITEEGTINLDFRDVETTMRAGGGALMAIGRAKGEKRVQNAILNALDSPLLYGSDISKAKNILFNIYTSKEHPLYISEMSEVDAFMYELDPDIHVIWGTSDDDTLGEDAKIIILATGIDNEFAPQEVDHGNDEKEYFNSIIEKLYREPVVPQKDIKIALLNDPMSSAEDSLEDTVQPKVDQPRNEEANESEVSVEANTEETKLSESNDIEPLSEDNTEKGEKQIDTPASVHPIRKEAEPLKKKTKSFVDRVRARIKTSIEAINDLYDE